jgi:hypothetical protein
MKRFLTFVAGAAALLGGVSQTFAAPVATYDVTCGSSILTVGTYSRDRDVSVSVVYDHGDWRVVHTLSNGHVYERGEQYDLADASNARNITWTGNHAMKRSVERRARTEGVTATNSFAAPPNRR